MAVAGQVKKSRSRDGHTVEIERDPVTGTVTYEAWYRADKLDRANGAAMILRDAATGIVTFEAWYKRGKLSRADGPAYIERDAAGVIVDEEWWKGGKLSCAFFGN